MRVIGYVQDSTADGEGLRDVLFLTGCDHKCSSCHNQVSWDANNGVPFTQDMQEKLISNLKRMRTPAITLSGGDPLHVSNYIEVVELCKKLKKHNINVWLYTGYTLEQVYKERPLILPHIDVLVDGKYIQELQDTSFKFRGSTNQKIIRSPFDESMEKL